MLPECKWLCVFEHVLKQDRKQNWLLQSYNFAGITLVKPFQFQIKFGEALISETSFII